ncbi:formate dehydrogenase subunit gamma [Advenella sp. RU8]|uniref:formate dehydrogenase subunit gamma n=1 Tax=Advenella sp. RU8 TaxID=3399575 RepID=UPI003AACB9BD
MKEKLIQRYNKAERVNHWIVAGCFVLLAISGLAFFYPAFFWLTGVFGTPQLARIIHPFVGVVMFVGFFIQFFRYWKYNFMEKEDVKWLTSVGQILKGEEVGDTGKYNAGQKIMFWLMTICMLTLLASGFIAWRPYFADMFPIPVIRIALLLHAVSALVLITGIIVHVYAAIWIKGTIRAMVEGVVTQAWAKAHHPRWYREIMAKKKAKDEASGRL